MLDTSLNFTYLGPNGVRLEMRHTSGMGGGAVTLSAMDVDTVIAQLSKLRGQMKPEIPTSLPDGEHKGPVDPIWRVNPTIDHKILFVRHPGLGWLSFLFPLNEARNLGNALLHSGPQTAAPQTQTGRPH